VVSRPGEPGNDGVTFGAKIAETFQITGRGLVIVFDVPVFRLLVNDPIQLRTPDGRIFDTHVGGIEMICGPKVDRSRMHPIVLPPGFSKQDVPIGTELWLVQKEPVPGSGNAE
jgi:hypothetical protein